MCLAVPMEIISIEDETRGTAQLGGVRYEVDLSLLDSPRPGEHVIVHAGFAIEKLDEQEARERLRLFEQLAAAQAGEEAKGKE